MKLIASILLLCWSVFAVQRVESQDLLPAPILEFDSSVNLSSIMRYSIITFVCKIPQNTSLPVEVLLSQAAKGDRSSLRSLTSRSLDPVKFILDVTPDHETAIVCWYRKPYTRVRSEFSNSLDVVVSALAKPKMYLIPPVFPVGMNYTVQCDTPLFGFKNVTVHMYKRILPIRPGKENFEYIGSLVLLPKDTGVVVQQTSVRETYQFLCIEEVFHNGRTIRSNTEITAMPEELPVRLVPTDSSSGTCYGKPFLKVKDDWRPLCFASRFFSTFKVANVICRDLGCGIAVANEKVSQIPPNSVGTPNCTGNEKKIAECPIFQQSDCDQELLVFCSASVSPPKLSLLEYGTPSRVYVRTEESVTLQCVFESLINEAYIVFTHNGNERYSTRARSGYIETLVLDGTVPEGEYACYVNGRGSSSNVIRIYVYDPPPAGAVAGGVITTIVGVIILVLLCVYRTSS